jgi:hypothetical protein
MAIQENTAAADKFAADKATEDKILADKAPKSPKLKVMVIAKISTITNPYTTDVFTKGIARDTPKKKDSWYKSQIEGGYLEEVKM